MWNPRMVLASLSAAFLMAAQPVDTLPKALVLRPGEGLAITMGDGEVHAYGDARREAPMGSLAKLAWMRLEGTDWSAESVRFVCTGTLGPFTCGNPKGHGRVDLGRALRADCNLAFLSWIAGSQSGWKDFYGEAAARARMEEVFSSFLGHRLPPGDTLPPLTAAWVGVGDLLRTSPEAFLRWLMEPEQAQVATFGKRYLAGGWVEVKDLLGKEDWWFITGTVPVVGEPAATSAWVAGGRGLAMVVLFIPRGTGMLEGMARIRVILGLKG